MKLKDLWNKGLVREGMTVCVWLGLKNFDITRNMITKGIPQELEKYADMEIDRFTYWNGKNHISVDLAEEDYLMPERPVYYGEDNPGLHYFNQEGR